MHGVTRHDEFETKFAAEPAFAVPDLVGIGPVASVRVAPVQHLTADYYDTDDLRLIRRRITLRRRVGGSDDGWHVKLPTGADDRRRTELHLPITTPGLPPLRFVDLLLGQTRGRVLEHVVTVHNRRSPLHLFDRSGEPLGELTDDRVTAERAGGTETFREIEVEVAPGVEPRVLTPVVEALLAAGALQSDLTSKAARSMGSGALAPADVGPRPALRATSSPSTRARHDLVPAVLSLQDADLLVRLDAAAETDPAITAVDAVRAALRQHRRTVGVAASQHLLGEIEGLRLLLADRTPEGRRDLLRAMHQGRYLTLLDELVATARAPGEA